MMATPADVSTTRRPASRAISFPKLVASANKKKSASARSHVSLTIVAVLELEVLFSRPDKF
jgi:hypothetical protein